MKAIVIDDLKRHGGGQMYGLTLANTLERIGYDTYFLTNVEESEIIGNKVAFEVDYEFVEGESKVMDFLKIIRLKRQLLRTDLKDFALTINNHPNVFLMRSDLNVLHGFSFLDPWLDENGELITKFPSIVFRLSRLYKSYEGSLFVPNSKYTELISARLFKMLDLEARMSEVLYPPVRSRKIDAFEKKDQVIVFGRISEHKGIEEVINIAKENSIKIVIAGFVNKGDEKFVERLRKTAGASMEVRTNLSEEEKEKLYLESSTILSLNKKEHFGMAVAEAMSYGCVPIVPKSGGQWTDILENGKYGLGYTDFSEIGALATESLNHDTTERKRIANSIERFSISTFEKTLRRITDYVTASRT